MIRLSGRGKAFAGLGAVLVLSTAFYLFALSPALSRSRILPGLIGRKQVELAEMKALSEKWAAFRTAKSEAQKGLQDGGRDFSLLGFLEDVLKETGIGTKIQSLQPVSSREEGGLQTEGMEMRMDGLTTRELVRFLERIERSARPLHIGRVRIQGSRKGPERSLKVTLQVHAYKPAG
ncbi:MAG: type II secretion system protein M [Deltaproteobacteria bacterium]|nr:type II secretion system protein M [Deltaproteobacteria bacterium]